LDDGWMRPVEGDEPETDHYEVESVHLGRMALPFIVAPATQTAQVMLSAIAGWQPPGRSGPIPPQLERRVLARRPARNQTTFPLPSEDCPSLPSCRGLFVLYPDGNMEWKDRGYIITSGLYFVRDDDPAIKALDWMDYSCR
jgi:hypothetical protein